MPPPDTVSLWRVIEFNNNRADKKAQGRTDKEYRDPPLIHGGEFCHMITAYHHEATTNRRRAASWPAKERNLLADSYFSRFRKKANSRPPDRMYEMMNGNVLRIFRLQYIGRQAESEPAAVRAGIVPGVQPGFQHLHNTAVFRMFCDGTTSEHWTRQVGPFTCFFVASGSNTFRL